MTCRAGAVLHSDIHTHTVVTEDLREAREIMYFRKQNNKKLLTRKFNKGLAAKQRVKKNQVSKSWPSSNITLGICAILLHDFCDTSQVSNASKEKSTLGQILIIVKNAGCTPRSKILRWNTLQVFYTCMFQFLPLQMIPAGHSPITHHCCGVGKVFSQTSAPGTSRAALHCWEPDPLAQNHLLDAELHKGALAQILSTGRKCYSHHRWKNILPPVWKDCLKCVQTWCFKHFYEGGITCFLSIKIQKNEQKVILYHCSNFSYTDTVKWQNV